MNTGGYIAAIARSEGPTITSDNDRFLMMRDPSRQRWFPIFQENDLIFGRPVDVTSAGSMYSGPSGGSDGHRQSLNHLGILAVAPGFKVGESAAFLVEVPLFGDLNEDRVVDGRDVAGFVQVMVDQANLTANERFPADYDVDGTINGVDLQSFVDALVGGS